MLFDVDLFTQCEATDKEPQGPLMAHVRDYRFPQAGADSSAEGWSPDKKGGVYQIWSLGEEHYTMVVPPRQGSGCECCDHPLQHVIKEALNTFDNAFPLMGAYAIIGNIRDGLTQWEDSL
jgi:hypothetical protein